MALDELEAWTGRSEAPPAVRRRWSARLRATAADVVRDQAAQALCSVSGLRREWRTLGALHDRVKRAWYAVRGRQTA
jgi:hypothetical protein